MAHIKSNMDDVAILKQLAYSMGVEKVTSYTMAHGHGVYWPDEDTIEVDYRNEEVSATYVLAHELVHATGHKNRMNRPGFNGVSFLGESIMIREELIANLACLQLIEDFGFEKCEHTENMIRFWLHMADHQVNEFVRGEVEVAVRYIKAYKAMLDSDNRYVASAI